MQYILLHYTDIMAIIGSVVTTASLVVKLTPSTKDDELLGKIIKVIEYASVFNRKTK